MRSGRGTPLANQVRRSLSIVRTDPYTSIAQRVREVAGLKAEVF